MRWQGKDMNETYGRYTAYERSRRLPGGCLTIVGLVSRVKLFQGHDQPNGSANPRISAPETQVSRAPSFHNPQHDAQRIVLRVYTHQHEEVFANKVQRGTDSDV